MSGVSTFTGANARTHNADAPNRLPPIVTALFAKAGLVRGAADASLNPIGSVTAITGNVELERSGHQSYARLSSTVLLADVYTTNPFSAITITLLRGAELQVGKSSSIIIDQDTLTPITGTRLTIIKLMRGKLHSIVSTLATGDKFSVRTGNAICGVRGTEFETEYIEGKPCPDFPDCLRYTDVGVYKGVVEVRSATNLQASPVLVSKGYETTVPCEVPPSSPSPLGASELELPGYHLI